MSLDEERQQKLERRVDHLEETVPLDLLGQLNEIKRQLDRQGNEHKQQLDRLDKAIVKLSFDTSGCR